MLALMYLALAAEAPAQAAPQTQVVVEGRRSEQALEDALQACLARNCGPYEYANRLLARANAAFVNGNYRTARSLLERGGRHLRDLDSPAKPVAALFEAQAIVAEHQGDVRDAIGANRRAIYALANGTEVQPADEIMARVDLADLLARRGKVLEARDAYRAAAAVADRAGLPNFRAAIEVRRTWLDAGNGAAAARRRLDGIAASPGTSESIRMAAAVLSARIAREHGDMQPTEALLAMLRQRRVQTEPMLMFAPPLPSPTAELNNPFQPRQTAIPIHTSERQTLQWADVGYWIRPSGRVDGLEVLRASRQPKWLSPVLASVSRRVYSPTAATDFSEGTYKVARFSLGYPMVLPTDSLIMRRGGLGVISELDLARQDQPPRPATAAP
jgi:hypothetical protein